MIELPEGYYLNNFIELIELIYNRDKDLLKEEERLFYRCFIQLPVASQYLYVRMLMRKGNFFREKKLAYREIPNVHDAAKHLIEIGLISLANPSQINEIIPILTKTEWLERFHDHVSNHVKKYKREQIDTWARSLLLDNQDILSEIIKEESIFFVDDSIFATFKILYFANASQDLTDFILKDMGLQRYPLYSIGKQDRSFQSRQQIESWIEFYALIGSIDDTLLAEEKSIVNLAEKILHLKSEPTLANKIQKSLLMLARQLERLEKPYAALNIYSECVLSPSRERQARIWDKLKYYQTSVEMCNNIIEQPLNEEEEEFAFSFLPRIKKKMGQPYSSRSNYTPTQEIIQLEKSEQSVEFLAKEYFCQFGECFYVENHLINTLFCLTYWDVIYQSVPGAFTHPFQHRPHDLYEEYFLKNRKDQYERANQNLDGGEYLNHLRTVYDQNLGCVNPYINWQVISFDLINLAVSSIPRKHLKALFDRIWDSPKANRSGFPDLVLFHTTGYQFIEIKGPGDKLQKNQKRWMNYFHQHGIPHKVANVEFVE